MAGSESCGREELGFFVELSTTLGRVEGVCRWSCT
jgi:hypothetical protein